MPQVEVVPITEITPDPNNANQGTERGYYMLTDSIGKGGLARGTFAARDADGNLVMLGGNKTLQASVDEGIKQAVLVHTTGEQLVVTVRDDLEAGSVEAIRLALADNRVGQVSLSFDGDVLDGLLAEAPDVLEGLWNQAELDALLPPKEPPEDKGAQVDKADELQDKWRVAVGDVWTCGSHFVICGDCREPATWKRLLDAAQVEKVNSVFTSPPYAEQRKKQYGGVPTSEYVDWWEAVQANVKANLAADGSFFVNIKEHCEKGQRVLYCKKLLIAMVERWGWRWVDELCWKHQGIPGDYKGRFKNQFEPVYHFSFGEQKHRHKNVSYPTKHIGPTYTNNQHIATSTQSPFEQGTKMSYDMLARPGNVIDCAIGDAFSHAAAFPVDLPSFFIRAYSDEQDVWIDPFLGSGTTIVSAHNHNRRGLGIERLEKYVSVTLERLADLGLNPQKLAPMEFA